ncbi:MAG TPA: glycosyltransferase family 4 protein [Thermoanaerobaculia bacterium]|nr:glycosyltransferase family 4 protein [Thermoanaerobaculia bacterium]
MLTPLPPEKTGVAHYASMLIPALAKRVDLVLNDFSVPGRIYQLGNNPYHEWVYEEAMRVPGIIVLHEIVLHHLIVEMTLARGDVEGYVAAMEENHGAAGAAWARGRAAGLHSEMGNFLLPASIAVARRSRGVIVHNDYAAERLRSFGVTVPIHVVAHPFEPHPEAAALRGERRRQLGFADDDRVVGFLGYVTAAKRPEVVVEAWSRARAADPKLRMLVVGDPAPNIDLSMFQRDGITFTGYAPDEEFPAYIAAVDQIVNLRYPSAGEASGILMRALEAGKPVAVSDYGPFAEMPDDCVVKIPFDGEVEALTKFFSNTFNMAAAQHRWLEQNATTEIAAEGYVRALKQATGTDAGVTRSIPLFPSIKATRHGTHVTLKNTGDSTLKARTYGQPGYRLIAKWDGGDRWYQLPRDLAPGDEATLEIPHRSRLYHALESIPMLEPEPFDEV